MTNEQLKQGLITLTSEYLTGRSDLIKAYHELIGIFMGQAAIAFSFLIENLKTTDARISVLRITVKHFSAMLEGIISMKFKKE